MCKLTGAGHPWTGGRPPPAVPHLSQPHTDDARDDEDNVVSLDFLVPFIGCNWQRPQGETHQKIVVGITLPAVLILQPTFPVLPTDKHRYVQLG